MQYRDELERDRAELQAILDDLKDGNLSLQHGQHAYVRELERRIAAIDVQLREN
jgi:hypothetical protein